MRSAITISLPGELLEAIDASAAASGMTRSAWIQAQCRTAVIQAAADSENLAVTQTAAVTQRELEAAAPVIPDEEWLAAAEAIFQEQGIDIG